MSNANKRLAVIQMNSQPDIAVNLAQAHELLTQAKTQGACVALLPEMFLTLDGKQYRSIAQAPYYVALLGEWARQLQLWIIAGALPQATHEDARVSSACLVFNDQGQQVARYNKIHLFDAEVSDDQGRYRESDHFAPGQDVVVVDTPCGRLGLAICYDLRFPELFRQLREQGAEIISVPAAFTYRTGEAHWQVLLRARAIEQQCYVLAANQCGWHDSKRRTYGHSQIIDPWGTVLVSLEEEVGIAWADVDVAELTTVRNNMPVASHRRLR